MTSLAEPVPPSKLAAACVVLTGNPNCGKTTLFNALTGLRAKVGNYAGVTVEKKEGRLLGSVPPHAVTVLDLPGTYSLSPQSPDEEISREVLFQRVPDAPAPTLVVAVLDASNLQRNLYYATQVIELGYPVVVALNMIDVARDNGVEVDERALSRELGVPVCPVIASTGQGLPELRETILKGLQQPAPKPDLFPELPAVLESEVDQLAATVARESAEPSVSPEAEALLLLTDEKRSAPAPWQARIREARERIERAGCDWRSAAIEGRYARVGAIEQRTCLFSSAGQATFSDRLDQVLTHRVWGLLIFLAIMAVMFQSIFSLAQYPMDWIEAGVGWLGQKIAGAMPDGDLRSLLVDGVVAGVGAVVVFLPQICLLFLFIGLLEDTGYMARAAFLMDRIMSKVGLHGKSFIPMLSSFACAIPGIMATRTIETPKDRLVTILVAPLMSCSARLPVYTLLIAACIPNTPVLGIFKLPGLTMLAMYLLGIVMALGMAWLFKKTLLRGETPLLVMELPPYKRPVFRIVMRHMWDRSRLFLRRAGTVILGISILLWFLATFPKSTEQAESFAAQRQAVLSALAAPAQAEERAIRLAELDNQEAGLALRNSFAGRLGHLIEPFIRPLGFDWKIGIGIVASFAAREVFVSTMSTVYNVGAAEADRTDDVAQTLREQRREDGTRVYTPLVAVTLMVFYVLALQCVSTVAVVRRETNSWKWPIFQWAYMGILAWVLAFATYQGGKLLGFN